MSRILQEEASLYTTAWNMGGYGEFSPGEHYLPIFIDALPEAFKDPLNIKPTRFQTVLDAGTGSGKGAKALMNAGFAVVMCDVTKDGIEDPDLVDMPFYQACLWHDLSHIGSFQWAYCCDVMEHIQPQFTMLVVQQLLNIVQHGVFFSIALVPDSFGFFAGEPLHKTVQDFDWWKASLGELGQVTDARDLGNTGTYLVMKQ